MAPIAKKAPYVNDVEKHINKWKTRIPGKIIEEYNYPDAQKQVIAKNPQVQYDQMRKKFILPAKRLFGAENDMEMSYDDYTAFESLMPIRTNVFDFMSNYYASQYLTKEEYKEIYIAPAPHFDLLWTKDHDYLRGIIVSDTPEQEKLPFHKNFYNIEQLMGKRLHELSKLTVDVEIFKKRMIVMPMVAKSIYVVACIVNPSYAVRVGHRGKTGQCQVMIFNPCKGNVSEISIAVAGICKVWMEYEFKIRLKAKTINGSFDKHNVCVYEDQNGDNDPYGVCHLSLIYVREIFRKIDQFYKATENPETFNHADFFPHLRREFPIFDGRYNMVNEFLNSVTVINAPRS